MNFYWIYLGQCNEMLFRNYTKTSCDHKLLGLDTFKWIDFVSSCLFQTVKLVLLETRIRKSKSMLVNESFFLAWNGIQLHIFLKYVIWIIYFSFRNSFKNFEIVKILFHRFGEIGVKIDNLLFAPSKVCHAATLFHSCFDLNRFSGLFVCFDRSKVFLFLYKNNGSKWHTAQFLFMKQRTKKT